MIEPFHRPSALALSINLAVIKAILLRDIRILTGAYCSGLVILLLMPLGHLLIVVVMFQLFGRVAPMGTDQIVYFGISILPFVIFAYMSRQVVVSLLVNSPLLYFNRVKVFDILIARGTLETANAAIVTAIIMLILLVYSNDFTPRDWPGFVFAIMATIYLSFCVGVSNALIAKLIPFWLYVFNLSIPIFWAASGIIFFPSAIPEPYGSWLALNPLLQCIEWIRYSYYEDYPDRLLNVQYLLAYATACLALSLIAERIYRRAIR
jgi:capsular polysaccharide transport system permease protein